MIDYIKLARQAGIDVLEVESERASKWPATPEGLAKYAELVLEEAAKEAEHWQKISTTPGHACGQYIAAAIREMKPNTADDRPQVRSI